MRYWNHVTIRPATCLPRTTRKAPLELHLCDPWEELLDAPEAGVDIPIFNLACRKDSRVRSYRVDEGWVTVRPSAHGRANVLDHGIFIFCVSRFLAELQRGSPPSPVVRFRAADLFRATGRPVNTETYHGIKRALARLNGTTLHTSRPGARSRAASVRFVDHWRIVRKWSTGRMAEVQVTLPDWATSAAQNGRTMPLHRDYFRLRSPLARRLYELAHTHCVRRNEWTPPLAVLQQACGSNSTAKEFRQRVASLVGWGDGEGALADYAVRLAGDDLVLFRHVPAV